MKPIRLFIEHQDSDYIKVLQSELEIAKKQYLDLKELHTALEVKYANEMIVNIELNDLLIGNGINYRSSANLHRRMSR